MLWDSLSGGSGGLTEVEELEINRFIAQNCWGRRHDVDGGWITLHATVRLCMSRHEGVLDEIGGRERLSTAREKYLVG